MRSALHFRTVLIASSLGFLSLAHSALGDEPGKPDSDDNSLTFVVSGTPRELNTFRTKYLSTAPGCRAPTDAKDKGHYVVVYFCPNWTPATFTAFGQAFKDFGPSEVKEDEKDMQGLTLEVAYSCTYCICPPANQRKMYRTGACCTTNW
jgi:hypothetical protein